MSNGCQTSATAPGGRDRPSPSPKLPLLQSGSPLEVAGHGNASRLKVRYPSTSLRSLADPPRELLNVLADFERLGSTTPGCVQEGG